MRLAVALLLLLLVSPACLAVDTPDEMLPDPTLEREAQQIGQQLRCLVCQNESIEESSAPLARDLRHAVRQQLQQGRTAKEIRAWMVQRYGEFIRLRPAFSPATALLWLMPLLGLMVALFLTCRLWHRPAPPPAPLTPEERRTLDSLLKKD
ncbi:cytochrome c-type biogenesis protein [Bombella mellum]|uniref:Cytochrome c-type biogenesis protein n=1 Tax=Bombella mellum TaxID=2039288 RepID=A0ABR5ZQC9_9PROT|nr:cytochrome c-type biogenesis protein [Bombella mellum]MBA5726536.1 cytochrome C biogenesis protein [Bombella mellum]